MTDKMKELDSEQTKDTSMVRSRVSWRAHCLVRARARAWASSSFGSFSATPLPLPVLVQPSSASPSSQQPQLVPQLDRAVFLCSAEIALRPSRRSPRSAHPPLSPIAPWVL